MQTLFMNNFFDFLVYGRLNFGLIVLFLVYFYDFMFWITFLL